MRKSSSLVTLAAMLLSCLGLMLFNACEKDPTPCDGVTCENGVPVQSGHNECKCDCDEGYSGEKCEKEDKCITQNVSCQNGGTCVDGTCNCPDGYSGTTCADEDLCTTNPPNCQNGSTCQNGVCVCPGGYEGTDCTTPSRDKMIGTYNGTDVCVLNGGSGVNYTYTIVITASGNAINEILISNLWDYFTSDVVATVAGNTFTIASQTPNTPAGYIYTVQGGGIYNSVNSTITTNYTVTNVGGSDTDQCDGTFTKQ